MSKKCKLASLVLAAALLSGCQSNPSTPTAGEGQTPVAATSPSTEVSTDVETGSTPTAPGETASQETPEAATQAFITAAIAKDTETLKTLIAPDAEKEFAGLRDGTADMKSLTELSEMFTGATVGKVELEDGGKEAEVEVALKERQESIELTNTPEGWKIKGF
jgi:hypothetical protein